MDLWYTPIGFRLRQDSLAFQKLRVSLTETTASELGKVAQSHWLCFLHPYTELRLGPASRGGCKSHTAQNHKVLSVRHARHTASGQKYKPNTTLTILQVLTCHWCYVTGLFRIQKEYTPPKKRKHSILWVEEGQARKALNTWQKLNCVLEMKRCLAGGRLGEYFGYSRLQVMAHPSRLLY